MSSLQSYLVDLSKLEATIKGCTNYAFVLNDKIEASSNSPLQDPHASSINQTWTVHINLPNERLTSIPQSKLPWAWETLLPKTLPFYNWREPNFGLWTKTPYERMWLKKRQLVAHLVKQRLHQVMRTDEQFYTFSLCNLCFYPAHSYFYTRTVNSVAASSTASKVGSVQGWTIQRHFHYA